uniref:Uncharacterized protein n=1 Tax=Onchocerca volvulus TaxID=6282 RepID=A0A8R1TRZ9_ONCVO
MCRGIFLDNNIQHHLITYYQQLAACIHALHNRHMHACTHTRTHAFMHIHGHTQTDTHTCTYTDKHVMTRQTFLPAAFRISIFVPYHSAMCVLADFSIVFVHFVPKRIKIASFLLTSSVRSVY